MGNAGGYHKNKGCRHGQSFFILGFCAASLSFLVPGFLHWEKFVAWLPLGRIPFLSVVVK